MFLHKINQETVVRILLLEEIHRLTLNLSLLITIVIINQLGITIVEIVNLHVPLIHIRNQPGQIQKVIVNLQRIRVHIVVLAKLEIAGVIPHPAGLLVAVSHILHHQDRLLLLPALAVEVDQDHHPAEEAPDQVVDVDNI